MWFVLCILIDSVCGDAAAHVGDRILPIYELTDQDLAMVDLHDGRTDDWSAVVGEPTVTHHDFEYQIGPLPTGRDDFDFRVWLAWHRSGRIYGAVEAADDVFVNWFYSQFSSVFLWDDTAVLFAVDADHGGEPYQSACFSEPCAENLQPPIEASNRLAQAYEVQGTTQLGTPVMRLQDIVRDLRPRSFADQAPYAEAGGRFFSENPVIIVTEFYVTAFDDLEHADQSASRVAQLEAGQIIGIALQVGDQDNVYERVRPTYFQMPKRWCCNAGTFADALLLPPWGSAEEEHAATPSSWARIKAQFEVVSPMPQTKRR